LFERQFLSKHFVFRQFFLKLQFLNELMMMFIVKQLLSKKKYRLKGR